MLALFTYVVYIPIRKITHAADEYSNGNFDAKIDVHSNDEIGYLAASLNYMANELNTLEEDQRKFISNVSHDFRSPLTSIKGAAGGCPPAQQCVQGQRRDGSSLRPTVMAHIGRLREKIHEPSKNPKFIKTVWGVGYTIEK